MLSQEVMTMKSSFGILLVWTHPSDRLGRYSHVRGEWFDESNDVLVSICFFQPSDLLTTVQHNW